MKTLYFEVPGKPIGLQRSRQDATGRRYDSKDNQENKGRIAHKAKLKALQSGQTLPLPAGQTGYYITITAYVAMPQSCTRTQRDLILRGILRPMGTPDIDNIAKLYLDALVQGGVIEDDRKVTELHVSREYLHSGGFEPFTAISVKWFDMEEAENE